MVRVRVTWLHILQMSQFTTKMAGSLTVVSQGQLVSQPWNTLPGKTASQMVKTVWLDKSA